MRTPRPLIERLQDCAGELDHMIMEEKAKVAELSARKTEEEITLGPLLAAWHHFSVICTHINLLRAGALNNRSLMQIEVELIEAHKECGTSLDLRGMTYINVYQHDRVQTLMNTWEPLRQHVASVLTYEDQAEQMKTEVMKQYGFQARPQTPEEIEEGFVPHFEIIIENQSALVTEVPSSRAVN